MQLQKTFTQNYLGSLLQHMLWRGLYFFSILLLNIGIARFFEADKSGQIFLIVNNLSIVLLIVSFSLESGTTFFISTRKLEALAMANFLLLWTALVSILVISSWWTILHYSKSIYHADSSFIVSSFFFISGVLLTTYFTALFYSKKEFGLPNKILFSINILLIISLFGIKGHTTVRSHFIEIYFISFFIQGLALTLFFYGKNSRPGKLLFPPLSTMKMVFRYSIFALVANLFYFFVNRIDYWFVKYYCSPDNLGNYIQASKLSQMMLLIPAILGSTLFPIFSSNLTSDSKQQLTAAIRALFFMNGTICLLMIAVGWYFIPLIFGHSFEQMYLLFVLLIPGILCVTINYPMAAWFSASKRMEVNLKGAAIALIVICLGDLIALPLYGVFAASIVSCAGYFSICFYTFYIYQKENAVPWRDFFLIRKSDLIRILQALRLKNDELSPENSIVQNSTV